jgi:hypothetical protein
LLYNTSCLSFPFVIKASIKVLTTFLSCSGIFSMALNWFRSSLSVNEVSANVYNEAGMLKTKYLHSTSVTTPFMQKIDYKYNIRGWLTGINDPGLASGEGDRFGMKLGNTEWTLTHGWSESE